METVEFKVPIPEGMEIDKKNSTFECIKFKPIKPKRWRDNKKAVIDGYYINPEARINVTAGACNCAASHNIFATAKQAKAALAMARISQIMVNDERFGGTVTDEEWNDGKTDKYCIERSRDCIDTDGYINMYHFLAFHTYEQRALFLKENEDLIKDYLMID